MVCFLFIILHTFYTISQNYTIPSNYTNCLRFYNIELQKVMFRSIGKFLPLLITLLFFTTACIEEPGPTNNKLSQEDEQQIAYTIDTALISHFNQSGTPLLEENKYGQIYEYIKGVIQSLNTTPYLYQSVNLRLIDCDTPMAFASVSGYIYIHTGLLESLHNEVQMAGVLSTMMACSFSKKPLDHLTDNFSNSYMMDLALGGVLTSPEAFLHELSNTPYNNTWVNTYSEKTINILCYLSYNILSYADLFNLDLLPDWQNLYPHPANFATTLAEQSYLSSCDGQINNQTEFEEMLDLLP